MGTATLYAVINRLGGYTLHRAADGSRDFRFTAFGLVERTGSKFTGKNLILQVVRAQSDRAQQPGEASAAIGAMVVNANLEPQAVNDEDGEGVVPPIEVYLVSPDDAFYQAREIIFSSVKEGGAARLSAVAGFVWTGIRFL
jgi:hypothetical protein